MVRVCVFDREQKHPKDLRLLDCTGSAQSGIAHRNFCKKKPVRDSERLWAFAFKYVQLSVSSLEDGTKEVFVKAPGAPPSQVRNMTNWWCRFKTCNGWTTTGDILAWIACPCVIRIETYCVDSACFCWRLKSIRSIISIQSNLMYWC